MARRPHIPWRSQECSQGGNILIRGNGDMKKRPAQEFIRKLYDAMYEEEL